MPTDTTKIVSLFLRQLADSVQRGEISKYRISWDGGEHITADISITTTPAPFQLPLDLPEDEHD